MKNAIINAILAGTDIGFIGRAVSGSTLDFQNEIISFWFQLTTIPDFFLEIVIFLVY